MRMPAEMAHITNLRYQRQKQEDYSRVRNVIRRHRIPVLAKVKGKATIKAKVGGKTLACKIKVENPYISDKELTMREGEEAFLEIKGCSHEPEWYCDDYDIVEVEDDGTIFASEAGVTTVYATVHGRIFSCKVTVLPVTEDIEDPDVEIEY